MGAQIVQQPAVGHVLESTQPQLAEQLLHGAIVVGHGPAAPLGRGHGQQRHRHLPRQSAVHARQPGKGPVGVQARGQAAGQAARVAFRHHGEFALGHQPAVDQRFQQAGAQHPGVGATRAQRLDHVHHGKAGLDQRPARARIRVQHLAQGDLPAAKGVAGGDGDAQVRQVLPVPRVPGPQRRDHGRADPPAGIAAVQPLDRGDARDAQPRPQRDVMPGVGDQEIHRPGRRGLRQRVQRQRHQHEIPPRQRLVQMGDGRGEFARRIGFVLHDQHPHADLRQRRRGRQPHAGKHKHKTDNGESRENRHGCRKQSQPRKATAASPPLKRRTPGSNASRRSRRWCPGEDSNFHALRHTDLNRARLPIPPPGPVS